MARSMILVSVLVVALLGAVAGTTAQEASPAASPPAGAIDVALRDVEGQEVGRATLTEAEAGAVAIEVSVEGLAPGEHGIHIHAVGVCDPAGDTPFASAGGHYNPMGAVHGGPPTMEAMGTPEADDAMGSPVAASGHAGDLGNITVDEAGAGQLQISTDRFRLMELDDADGSALVIHADPDDLQTDPSGNSGGRIVCGVIVPSPEGGTPVATPAS
ncbi:MAG: superoxide dismutase family protein [Chloroflexia bacterium]|nr:superoxide dismutase family protein [Chloroflexia bacterium]